MNLFNCLRTGINKLKKATLQSGRLYNKVKIKY